MSLDEPLSLTDAFLGSKTPPPAFELIERGALPSMSPDSDSSSESESESGLGRKRAREHDPDDETLEEQGDEGQGDGAERRQRAARSRKSKKRARKGPDGKPHQCQHPGCGKSYTRAEHLHRHELNHEKPREYRCPRANCDFLCVRKDLLDRHEERHLKPGSNLNRRDAQRAKRERDQVIAPASDDNMVGPINCVTAEFSPNGDGHFFRKPTLPYIQTPVPVSPNAAHDLTSPVAPLSASATNDFAYSNWPQPAAGSEIYSPAAMPKLESMSLTSSTGAPGTAIWMPRSIPMGHGIDGVAANTPPPFDPGVPFSPSQNINTSNQAGYGDLNAGFGVFTPESIPFFDDVFAFDSFLPRDHETATNDESAMRADFYSAWESVKLQNEASRDTDSEMSGGQSRPPLSRTATPMQNLLNPSSIPCQRTRDLLRLVEETFEEPPKEAKCGIRIANHGTAISDFFSIHANENPGYVQGEMLQKLDALLGSDYEVPESAKIRLRYQLAQIISQPGAKEKRLTPETRNALNSFSVDQYLKSYWDNFHPQLPILHKQRILHEQRTIGRRRDAYESVHDLQLLTMVAIGAVMLDSKESRAVQSQDQAVGLALFLMWNVRSKLMNHTDYMCPTQLWVLQTLVLLEVYEKLLSNRTLHERAQIHHTSTITLLRRGSALVPPTDLSLDFQDPEIAWEEFARIESFKRVALATFIIDRTHATMFSHFAQMSYTEVTRLSIPCDDDLWECGKAEDFRLRVQSSKNRHAALNPGNLKDHVESAIALKKPADCLRSNLFACKTVLAGLLGFRYELQRLRWFDDEEKARKGLTDWCRAILRLVPNHMEKDSVHDLRAMMCLAQVCTRSQVVEIQRYAGAPRVMGRDTTDADRKAATEHVCKWARLSNARAAALTGLQWLVELSRIDGSGINISCYNPREDLLLYRPWAVYMSMLCIWSYVYTIEGPVSATERPDLSSDVKTTIAANAFLVKASKLMSEDDLMAMDGRNRCIGLLRLLSGKLQSCRWELLREASERLLGCARLLDGWDPPLTGQGRKPGLTEFSVKTETAMKFKARKSALEKERKRTSERMEDLMKTMSGI